jgi:hypothetical protein
MPSRASTPAKHSDELGKLFARDGRKLEDAAYVGGIAPDTDPEHVEPAPRTSHTEERQDSSIAGDRNPEQ